ncbi:MAG TPA: NADP-dependent malic enzyme [Planctomycetes bacterium]|nr:NADP-dependent malic enzyme [Planctomycetota bacterium]
MSELHDYNQLSLDRHRQTQGKIETSSRMRLESQEDLSIAYTPGVARPCEVIAEDPGEAWNLTWKGRTVAVVSDGSAILGLGDLGPLASLPVMEGKSALFREFAGVDSVPIVLDVHEPEEIVRTIRAIAPTFGAINLEDISAPRCFEVEDALQDIGIPVLHDDQHGTAIVLLAALRNAARAVDKPFSRLRVVLNGAGAAGRAIARLLTCADGGDHCSAVEGLRICDSKGIIWEGRPGNTPVKEELARLSNPEGMTGSLQDALDGADAFIGVSRGNLLHAEDIQRMAPDAIVLAMANPTPEIDPDEARAGGALVVGTGRSDYPNQVNNVLVFPGLFRGALEARATRFTPSMQFAAIDAVAACVEHPTPMRILPSPFDRSVAVRVARAVARAARDAGVCHG